ncbi:MAG: alcohol dehydrogenase, partial [Nakamurella sp.]
MSEQLLSARSGWPAVDDQLPDTMTAVVFEEFGAPEVLQMAQLDTPHPGPGEVVVRVAAVSVGRLLD